LVEETRELSYEAMKIQQYFERHPDVRLIAIVGNEGRGLRQGIVGALFGSKGDIVVLENSLKEIALRTAFRFGGYLPRGQWIVSVPSDLVMYWRQRHTEQVAAAFRSLENADVVVLGTPGIEKQCDPPFPSLFAARRECLHELETEARRCLAASRMLHVSDGPNPFWKGTWWSFLIRPALLTLRQWSVASGNRDVREETWNQVWYCAQDFIRRTRVRIEMVTLDAVSTNANGNKDLYSLYQRVVGCWPGVPSDDTMKVRKLLKLRNGRVIQSSLRGEITQAFTSLIHRSTLIVPDGCRLQLGHGVVIDDSQIHVRSSAGGEIVIPDRTVISHSSIEGELTGGQAGGAFIIGVDSDSGICFEADCTQTTVRTCDGRRLIASIPFKIDLKDCLDKEIAGLAGLTLREATELAFGSYGAARKYFVLEPTAGVMGASVPVKTAANRRG
jgi:hypothetical protein